MTVVIRSANCSHLHVITAYLGIIFDGDRTYSKAWFRCCRQTRYGINVVSTHRSLLATTIDAAFHLGLTLNGYRTVTTCQTRVAMSGHTLSTTIDVALDDGSTGIIARSTDGHIRIGLQSGHLTTTIDVTRHGTVGDADIRSVGHCFLAQVRCTGCIITLTASEYITSNTTASNINIANASILSIVSAIGITIDISECIIWVCFG